MAVLNIFHFCTAGCRFDMARIARVCPLCGDSSAPHKTEMIDKDNRFQLVHDGILRETRILDCHENVIVYSTPLNVGIDVTAVQHTPEWVYFTVGFKVVARYKIAKVNVISGLSILDQIANSTS